MFARLALGIWYTHNIIYCSLALLVLLATTIYVPLCSYVSMMLYDVLLSSIRSIMLAADLLQLAVATSI